MFDIDVDEVALPRLESEICAWAGRLAAGTCAWLLAVAAFDRRDGWSGVGIRSCAHWLSWKCGISLRTAAEQVRVARALEALPLLREAFAAGRLSYSKVRAITRVATPADEVEWVRQATSCTAGQLDRLVTAWRRTYPADPDDTPGRRRDKRGLRWRWDDGDLVLNARLPPEAGAALVAAIEAARASLVDTTPPDTTPPDATAAAGQEGSAEPTPPEDQQSAASEGAGHTDGPESCTTGRAARLTESLRRSARSRQTDADALTALAEGFLGSGAPVLSNPGRYAVNVLVDARLLDARRHLDAAAAVVAGAGIHPPCCEVDPGGIGLHPATARRLACDSLLTTLLTDPDGNPLAVGRAHRNPPARQRKALHARDRHCTYPGCEHTRWLEAHHVEHWGRGGDTDLENLTLLCSYHHHAVHEGGITLRRLADGTVVAVLPDGKVIHPAPATTAGDQPLGYLRHATSTVAPDASLPRWHGDHLNLADSITAIIQTRNARTRTGDQARTGATP